MTIPRATTLAEANAQTLILPAFKEWRRFATTLDGYKIAAELDLPTLWYAEQKAAWEKTHTWDGLDILHLRLMLFYAFRSDYLSGYTYTEEDEMVDSILHALSQRLNLPYDRRFTDA